MSEISREWVDKARGDYYTALREYRARKFPNYDAACFHAQQCIEKLLKGELLEIGIPFPKIHDLEVLLDLILKKHPLLEPIRKDTQLLTQYAVQFRYPGENADKQEAGEAIAAMKRSVAELAELSDISFH